MIPLAMPPIVEAWTQNFQWSLGIVRVSFLQTLCTWYTRASGGTPSRILSSLPKASVRVHRRSNAQGYNGFTQKAQSVLEIERVSFKANIEISNFFLSGFFWFVISVMMVSAVMAISKLFSSRFKKSSDHDLFHWCGAWGPDYFKGALFRLVRLFVLIFEIPS